MPFEMERQILTIMNHVDGVNDSPFHDPDNPIVITEYTFTSKRMGNVSLTATLMHDTCLDDEWDGTQYVIFNGEKYFISATPSSSKSSDDARYQHDLTFMAERDIKLNNIYFYDAVSEESTDDDKYKSNSTKVVFFGDIHEFVARLNESLAYSNVGYTAVVDEGITSEAKLMSFEDQFFFNVLQEIFNVYELPFYFVGTVIHIGFTANAITHPFKYGIDNELISIKKNNANYRIVTRCTGAGSSDNIPYYYPNNTPKGDIAAKAGASNTGVLQKDISIKDMELFARSFDFVTPLLYEEPEVSGSECFNYIQEKYRRINPNNIPYHPYVPGTEFSLEYDTDPSDRTRIIYMKFSGHIGGKGSIDLRVSWGYQWTGGQYYATFATEYPEEDIELSNCVLAGISGSIISLKFDSETDFSVSLKCYIRVNLGGWSGNSGNKAASFTVSYTPYWQKSGVWLYGEKPVTDIGAMGISIGDAEPENGDTIMQVQERFITPSDKLLPPIYRESDGAERFYNAVNDTYTNPDTGEKYVFENQFVANAPKEHIVEFEDIKPTIKGAENASGQHMDQILDIAFDTDDNDDVDEEGNYLHPHFFVKLAKFDGEWGFNLFDQAIEDEEMTLAMTSGDCGACEFTIKVGEETQKNIVQVDSSGNLMRDENGNVITSGEPQDRQNDTRNHEVWLALEKEESTYGQIMPNALQNIRPKTGDTFVFLNIKMPDEYVYRAENELKEAIIKYMAENNAEKFNFSIDFSRIYLAQNKDIASQLNENARIQLEYNGKLSEFYISQYTYKCVDGEALPEVTVELTDTVTVTKTTLQNSIDAVQQDIQNGIGSIDFLKQGLRYFLRKDMDDEARGTPRFLAGAEFGRFVSGILGSGAAVRIDSNNASHMEVDYLSVRRRADFTTISVQELKQIGGQLIISPAAMICSRVEETETAYRCHFDINADEGRQSIYNQFAEGDQARMQTFNQLGSRYFWRLVTAVGDDWIDLSKTDCEEGSDIPQEGDNIVQLGNRNDTTRQSAQVFSCFGENAPSFIMYNGINSYDLTGKNITGIVYNPETGEPQMYSYGAMFFGDRDIEAEDANYITFQQKPGDSKKKLYISADIHIGPGSSGLSNLEEWAETQKTIETAGQKADDLQYLKEIFQKPTLDSEGAILAKLLAVKDDNGNIVAGLNASYEVGESPTTDGHGRLLIFGGSQDLESASQAKTRIYEDGLLYTTSAKVKGRADLTMGSIDSLHYGNKLGIIGGLLHVDTAGEEIGRSETQMENGFFNNIRKDYAGREMQVSISANSDSVLSSIIRDIDDNIIYVTMERKIPKGFVVRLENNRTDQISEYDAALEIIAKGTGAQYMQAIRCDAGLFAGLRPMTRTMTKSGGLTKYDHTIVVDTTSPITIGLDIVDLEAGQTFDIYISNTSSVTYKHTIASLTTPMHFPNANIWSADSIPVDAYGLIRVTCAKSRTGNLCWWLYRLA